MHMDTVLDENKQILTTKSYIKKYVYNENKMILCIWLTYKILLNIYIFHTYISLA
jgi:hypothetical protein